MRYIIQFLLIALLCGAMLGGLSMMESDPALFWTGLGLTFGSVALMVILLAGMGVINIKPYLSSSIRSDLGSEH